MASLHNLRQYKINLFGMLILLAACVSGCASSPAPQTPSPATPTPAVFPVVSANLTTLSSRAMQVDNTILPAYLTINDILQDETGFLWFATERGLYRYDGYHLDLYLSPSNTDSRTEGGVFCLSQGHSGMIWIGAGNNSFYRYNPLTLQFTQFDLEDPAGGLLHVSTILEDRSGVVWVGTRENGLYRLDLATNLVTSEASGKTATWWITSLVEDPSGALWIANKTRSDIDRFDPQSAQWTYFSPNESEGQTGNASGGFLALDGNGNLWLATPGAGVFHYFTKEETWVQFPSDMFASTPLDFTSVEVDPAGLVWLGTSNDGVFQLDAQSGKVTALQSSPSDANSLSSNHIQALLEDRSGLLWVGMSPGGLDRLNLQAGIQQIQKAHGNPNSLISNQVNTVYVDAGGSVWVGTPDGLSRMDPGGRWTLYPAETQNSAGFSGQDVMAVFVDHLGSLWVGTRQGGLSRLDVSSGSWTYYGTESGLLGSSLTAIAEDRTGRLWVLRKWPTLPGQRSRAVPGSTRSRPGSSGWKSIRGLFHRPVRRPGGIAVVRIDAQRVVQIGRGFACLVTL